MSLRTFAGVKIVTRIFQNERGDGDANDGDRHGNLVNQARYLLLLDSLGIQNDYLLNDPLFCHLSIRYR